MKAFQTVVLCVTVALLALSRSTEAQCSSNPCQNGGTCRDIPVAPLYYCLCPLSYSGVNCEINLTRFCAQNLGYCQNGGTCTVQLGTLAVKCICSAQYTGTQCENMLNSCFDVTG